MERKKLPFPSVFNKCLSFTVFFSYLICGADAYSDSLPSASITLISTEPYNYGQVVRTITDKVNHEVLLTTQTVSGRLAYLLQCNASIPVEWNYLGEGAPSLSADIGRHFQDFYNVNSYTYQAILTLTRLEELQSGRYVCRPTSTTPDVERNQIHYDIFVPGNGSQVLLSTADKKVFVPDSKLLISLPCEVSDPSVTLDLFKEDEWGSYAKLELNSSLIFRARKGFILKMSELPSPFGTYVCATKPNVYGTPKKTRRIHLIPEAFRYKYQNEEATDDNNSKDVRISYDFQYNRMLCCNNGSTDKTPRLEWAGCGSLLDCQIKSVCFDQQRCGAPTLKSRSPMVLIPTPRGCSAQPLEEESGIFKCSGIYQPYLVNRGNVFTEFEGPAPPSESILTLNKISKEQMYLGSEVEYSCNSTKFFFAYGIRWGFKRGNDEIEFIHESSTYIVRDKYPISSHKRQTTFRLLSGDIKAIICFVPIASSPTEWRTVSLPIAIRDSQQVGYHPQYPGSNYSPSPPVEPYSTSRPHPLPYPNSLEALDPTPTPSVDIGDIISLGKDKQPVDLDNAPVPSQIKLYHHEYPPTAQISRDYVQKPMPTNNYYYPPPQHYHQPQRSQEPKNNKAQGQPTDIITLDNLRQYQQSQRNQQTHQVKGYLDKGHHTRPSSQEIHEANARHREKLGLVAPPQTPTPISRYEPQRYNPDRNYNPNNHHHEHYHEYTEPQNVKNNNYQESPKEFKVSSQLNFGPKYKQGSVSNDDEILKGNRLRENDPYFMYTTKPPTTTPIPYYMYTTKPTTTPTPYYIYTTKPTTTPAPYFQEKNMESFPEERQYNNHNKNEAYVPMHLPLPLPTSQVIHYDSKERQYSLKDPLILQSQKNKDYKNHLLQKWREEPPAKWSKTSSHSQQGVILETEVPVDLDSLPYATDDYYISSLMSKNRPIKDQGHNIQKGGYLNSQEDPDWLSRSPLSLRPGNTPYPSYQREGGDKDSWVGLRRNDNHEGSEPHPQTHVHSYSYDGNIKTHKDHPGRLISPF